MSIDTVFMIKQIFKGYYILKAIGAFPTHIFLPTPPLPMMRLLRVSQTLTATWVTKPTPRNIQEVLYQVSPSLIVMEILTLQAFE